MRRHASGAWNAGLILLVVGAIGADRPAPEARRVGFAAEVRPIFERACFMCHGPEKQRSGFRLDEKAGALKGGDLGPAIVPGRADESPLIDYVAGVGDGPTMPPKGPRLSPVEVATLRRWIDQGADWPDPAGSKPTASRGDWWSLRPVARPPLPRLHPEDAARARNPIDAFILAKLREEGLSPSPEADRRTLIRRLSFDLTGLPPTPEEIGAFIDDHDPDAYERLVDRLLGSPRYGERWARHWLDVVHYADSHGYDKDKPRPNAWPYRDYVIRALNQDNPYARFVEEQLAGDVLFPGTRDGVEALGFIAAGPWDFIGHAEVPESKADGQVARLLDRDDMVANALNSFSSLTVQCARCHDHKFDPVTQDDYYSLQAVFAALDRADRPYDPDPEIARRRAALADRRRALADWIETLRREAADIERDRLDEATRALAEVDRQAARLPMPRLVYAGTVHHGWGAFRGTGPDGGRPRTIRVLRRGDVRSPSRVVGPGTVALLEGVPSRFDLPENAPEGARRAALARWITDRRHPLTWRSVVNRAWQYHFGRGLADSPNDFGRMGQLPTHPELLDWLAAEFRDGGQSLKRLHRLVVTSATYRQSSASDEARGRLDGGNRFLWRMNRRRLEAEEIRDAVLAVAGRLDERMGGPGFQDFVIERPEHSPHYRYDLANPDDPATHRRSIYRFTVRSQPQPFLAALDCADPSSSVPKRNEGLTAPQALALLNDRLMIAMAGHFANRLARERGDVASRIDRAVALALGRPTTPDERAALLDHAQRFGLLNTCRILYNLNEFAFMD